MMAPRVLFVLPAAGGSGGANSVVQECIGLGELGVAATIAVDSGNFGGFVRAYPELAERKVAVRRYRRGIGLAAAMRHADVVVATINTTLADVRSARERIRRGGASPRIAYYVQDYEPLFYPPESEDWRIARRSYTLIEDAVLFAKTDWLCDIVRRNHGVHVHRVEPSLDHGLFHARARAEGPRARLVAMLRPSTARRAPLRTMRILARLAAEFGDAVECEVFGQNDDDLAARGFAPPPSIVNRGRRARADVAARLRSADLFLDLSDYQAFGRAALEAMACGCPVVAPVFGGAGEFVAHGENGFLVDTRSDDAILAAARDFLALAAPDRARMREAAIATAARYDLAKAAQSELSLFLSMLAERNAGAGAPGRAAFSRA